jgi:hypothetical protein
MPMPAPMPMLGSRCGTSGACVSTSRFFSGDLGGLDGADRICQSEYPGSHFYRASCDSGRTLNNAFGYAELELGPCWDCAGWTSDNSGQYRPGAVQCPTGYPTVGAELPYSVCLDPLGNGHCWRICEAGDKPLLCCTP